MSAATCDGRCIYGSELIEGASGVAIADPLCSLHGSPFLCCVCGVQAEVAYPDGDGNQVGYCAEHEPYEETT